LGVVASAKDLRGPEKKGPRETSTKGGKKYINPFSDGNEEGASQPGGGARDRYFHV